MKRIGSTTCCIGGREPRLGIDLLTENWEGSASGWAVGWVSQVETGKLTETFRGIEPGDRKADAHGVADLPQAPDPDGSCLVTEDHQAGEGNEHPGPCSQPTVVRSVASGRVDDLGEGEEVGQCGHAGAFMVRAIGRDRMAT
jgi:hypothetical protein